MPRSFDILARPYRWLEYFSFGPYLWRCRMAHIGALQQARRVLLAGDGDGRFLAEVQRRYPGLEVHYLDSSPAMLEQARARCPEANFHLVSLPGADLPTAYFDAIVTHFFFDCFTPEVLPKVISELAQAATPEAVWIVSDFQPTRHLWGRLIVRALYAAFRLLTGLAANHLTAYESHLRAAGFELEKQESLLSGLLSAERWQRKLPPQPPPRQVA